MSMMRSPDTGGIADHSETAENRSGIGHPFAVSGLFIIWEGKALILVASLIGFLAGALYVYLATPKYTATLHLVTIKLTQGIDIVGRLGQAGAPSVLGGLLSRGQVDPNVEQFLELLTSERVAERLESRHGVLRIVYEPLWDEEKQEFKEPRDLRSRALIGVRSLLGLPGWIPPDASDLARFLKENITVSQSNKLSVRQLTVAHADRNFAKNLLKWVAEEADAILREETRHRAQRVIAHLLAEIERKKDTDHRQILFNLLAEQERLVMLLDDEISFVMQPLQGPVASSLPTSPRLIILLLGMIVGLGLGVTTVLGRAWWHASRNELRIA